MDAAGTVDFNEITRDAKGMNTMNNHNKEGFNLNEQSNIKDYGQELLKQELSALQEVEADHQNNISEPELGDAPLEHLDNSALSEDESFSPPSAILKELCIVCNGVFPQGEEFTRHIQSHGDTCLICDTVSSMYKFCIGMDNLICLLVLNLYLLYSMTENAV